jgi:redox-sensitive bicupin YhaK (pirin superfamily)
MNSGAGIIHSERPSQSLTEKNEGHEVIQLWINSPASKKIKPPTYQYIPES